MKKVKLHRAGRKYLSEVLTMLTTPKDPNQAPLMVPSKIYLEFLTMHRDISDVEEDESIKTVDQIKTWIKDNQTDDKELELTDGLFDFMSGVMDNVNLPPFAAGAYMNILAQFSPLDIPVESSDTPVPAPVQDMPLSRNVPSDT